MSKGLEALARLFENDYHKPLKYIMRHRDRQTIEKELKALEIIRKLFDKPLLPYEDLHVADQERITKEEFDLLKEVLLWD